MIQLEGGLCTLTRVITVLVTLVTAPFVYSSILESGNLYYLAWVPAIFLGTFLLTYGIILIIKWVIQGFLTEPEH